MLENLYWSRMSNQIFCVAIYLVYSAVLISLNYVKYILNRVLFVFKFFMFYEQDRDIDNTLSCNIF